MSSTTAVRKPATGMIKLVKPRSTSVKGARVIAAVKTPADNASSASRHSLHDAAFVAIVDNEGKLRITVMRLFSLRGHLQSAIKLAAAGRASGPRLFTEGSKIHWESAFAAIIENSSDALLLNVESGFIASRRALHLLYAGGEASPAAIYNNSRRKHLNLLAIQLRMETIENFPRNVHDFESAAATVDIRKIPAESAVSVVQQLISICHNIASCPAAITAVHSYFSKEPRVMSEFNRFFTPFVDRSDATVAHHEAGSYTNLYETYLTEGRLRAANETAAPEEKRYVLFSGSVEGGQSMVARARASTAGPEKPPASNKAKSSKTENSAYKCYAARSNARDALATIANAELVNSIYGEIIQRLHEESAKSGKPLMIDRSIAETFLNGVFFFGITRKQVSVVDGKEIKTNIACYAARYEITNSNALRSTLVGAYVCIYAFLRRYGLVRNLDVLYAVLKQDLARIKNSTPADAVDPSELLDVFRNNYVESREAAISKKEIPNLTILPNSKNTIEADSINQYLASHHSRKSPQRTVTSAPVNWPMGGAVSGAVGNSLNWTAQQPSAGQPRFTPIAPSRFTPVAASGGTYSTTNAFGPPPPAGNYSAPIIPSFGNNLANGSNLDPVTAAQQLQRLSVQVAQAQANADKANAAARTSAQRVNVLHQNQLNNGFGSAIIENNPALQAASGDWEADIQKARDANRTLQQTQVDFANARASAQQAIKQVEAVRVPSLRPTPPTISPGFGTGGFGTSTGGFGSTNAGGFGTGGRGSPTVDW